MKTVVLKQHVSPIEIGKYYLKCEMGTIFNKTEDNADFWNAVEKSINSKSDKEVWRLLQAFSGAYRLNEVFSRLSSDAFDWSLEIVYLEDIELTGINPQVNKLLIKFNYDLKKFSDYLKRNSTSDPEGLNSFRDKKRNVRYDSVIGWEENGKIKLLDGAHRVVTLFLQGNRKIKVYIARRIKEEGEETKLVAHYPLYILWWMAKKSYNGDKKIFNAVLDIFRSLRKRFRNTDEVVNEFLEYQPDDEATKALVKKYKLLRTLVRSIRRP